MKGKNKYTIKIDFTSNKMLTQVELDEVAQSLKMPIKLINAVGMISWDILTWTIPSEETLQVIEAKVRDKATRFAEDRYPERRKGNDSQAVEAKVRRTTRDWKRIEAEEVEIDLTPAENVVLQKKNEGEEG